jgi:hypothetical protein
MEIIQHPISENHMSSMFFNGVVAYGKANNGKTYVLRTEQQGQIEFEGQEYLEGQIRELGTTFAINDVDIDAEDDVTILVDNFFTIAEVEEGNLENILDAEVQDESRIFNEFSEAIGMFTNFLMIQ